MFGSMEGRSGNELVGFDAGGKYYDTEKASAAKRHKTLLVQVLHASLEPKTFARILSYCGWRDIYRTGAVVRNPEALGHEAMWHAMCLSAQRQRAFLVVPKNVPEASSWEELFRTELHEDGAGFKAARAANADAMLAEKYPDIVGARLRRGAIRATRSPAVLFELDHEIRHWCGYGYGGCNDSETLRDMLRRGADPMQHPHACVTNGEPEQRRNPIPEHIQRDIDDGTISADAPGLAMFGIGGVTNLVVNRETGLKCCSDTEPPLHKAAKEGCAVAIEMLLAAGADVNTLDQYHASTLDVHGKGQRLNCGDPAQFSPAIVRLLRLHGGLDAGDRAVQVLEEAEVRLQPTLAQIALLPPAAELRAARSAAQLRANNVELFNAARDGEVPAVVDMLSAGANPSLPCTAEGATAFHLAVAKGHLDVVRLLIAGGADCLLRTKPIPNPQRAMQAMMAAMMGSPAPEPERSVGFNAREFAVFNREAQGTLWEHATNEAAIATLLRKHETRQTDAAADEGASSSASAKEGAAATNEHLETAPSAAEEALKKNTVPALKQMLGERGLVKSGKKQDLINRLLEFDQ
jgi:ankyrin repeat protein